MEIINSTSIYKDAPLEDINLSTDLTQTGKPLDDYDIIKLLKISEQFVKEQQKSRSFRLHGTISLVSQLNNRPVLWDNIEIVNMETPRLNINYSMDNSLDFYVGYVSEYVPVFEIGSSYYQQKITLITGLNSVDIFPCGFSQNIYQEKNFNFIVENEVDITDLYSIGLPASCPVTELFIYCQPKTPFSLLDFSAVTSFNGFNLDAGTTFGFSVNFVEDDFFRNRVVRLLKPTTFAQVKDLPFYTYIIGIVSLIFKANNILVTYQNILANKDIILEYAGLSRIGTLIPSMLSEVPSTVMGNIVYFNEVTMEINEVLAQQYEVKQSVDETVNQSLINRWSTLGFNYNVLDNKFHLDFSFLFKPFHKISVLDFSEFLETDNLLKLAEIPPFSLVKDGSNLVKWRDILDPGFIEPTSKRGFDFPFINKCHYVFKDIKLFMKPNLVDYNTYRLFKSAINKVEIYGNTIR